MRKYILIAVIFTSLLILFATPANAQEESTTSSEVAGKAIAAAIAVGLASIGAGFAVAKSAEAAIAAVSEKPELLGKTILFVGLAEGIAIYGILIAILVIFVM